ncbi:MAG: crossover junction endodeoxyribonuclease RuvC [Candidatus Omnitrophota bacterium]
MRILGIDPALTITGYGIVDALNKEVALLEAGVIKTSPRDSTPDRLNKIHTAVMKLIQDTHPGVMVLEKLYAHYRHPTTAYLLGQARGVICLACAEKGIPLVEYAATRVKKAVCGLGLASKIQIQRTVADIFKLRSLPKYNDVTDALALAIAHSYMLKSKI